MASCFALHWAKRGMACLALIGFVVPALAAPFPVHIEVQASQRFQPVNPKLLGSNTPWVYGSEGLLQADGDWKPAVWTLVREISPTLLRYPGTPDTYDWRKGVGPLNGRPAVLAYPGQPLQKIVYGTQEFLETCEALGAEPLIEVNMHDGDDASLARLAADWVKFTNSGTLLSRRSGKPLPHVRYWELGNEPYLMEVKLPDGSPNRLMQRPEAYARRISAVMAAMRAVDPAVRIGLPFALDTLSGRAWRPGGEPASVVGPQLGYADRLLAGLARPQDVGWLALHHYMPLVNNPQDAQGRPLPLPDERRMYWAAAAGSETLRRHIDTVNQFWRGHPRTARLPVPPFVITEYNAFFSNRHVDGKEVPQNAWVASMGGAIFAADMLRVYAQTPGVEAALQWSLNGNWIFGAIGVPDGNQAPWQRPIADVMRGYRELLRAGDVVATQVKVASTDAASQRVGFAEPWPAMPLASAIAVRDGKTVKVVVIQKDPDHPADIRLDLPGQKVVAATVQSLHAKTPFDAADTPQAVLREQPPATLGAGGTQVRWAMPPASLALAILTLE
jgi:alpha-L-arabinofuranosidase